MTVNRVSEWGVLEAETDLSCILDMSVSVVSYDLSYIEGSHLESNSVAAGEGASAKKAYRNTAIGAGGLLSKRLSTQISLYCQDRYCRLFQLSAPRWSNKVNNKKNVVTY